MRYTESYLCKENAIAGLRMLKIHSKKETIEALSAVIAILFTTTMKRGLHHHTIDTLTLHNGSYRTHFSHLWLHHHHHPRTEPRNVTHKPLYTCYAVTRYGLFHPFHPFQRFSVSPVSPVSPVSFRFTPYISETKRNDLNPSTTPKTLQ